VIKSNLRITVLAVGFFYSIFHVGSGLFSGAIKELGKGNDMVLASDSFSFGLNVLFRLFVALISGGGAIVLWVHLRREKNSGVSD
jgi:hypothetical protein